VPESLRHTYRYEDGKNETQHDQARYEVAFGKAESGELQICAETLWLIDSGRAASRARRPSAPVNSRCSRQSRPRPPLSCRRQDAAGWQTVVKKVVAAE